MSNGWKKASFLIQMYWYTREYTQEKNDFSFKNVKKVSAPVLIYLCIEEHTMKRNYLSVGYKKKNSGSYLSEHERTHTLWGEKNILVSSMRKELNF